MTSSSADDAIDRGRPQGPDQPPSRPRTPSPPKLKQELTEPDAALPATTEPAGTDTTTPAEGPADGLDREQQAHDTPAQSASNTAVDIKLEPTGEGANLDVEMAGAGTEQAPPNANHESLSIAPNLESQHAQGPSQTFATDSHIQQPSTPTPSRIANHPDAASIDTAGDIIPKQTIELPPDAASLAQPAQPEHQPKPSEGSSQQPEVDQALTAQQIAQQNTPMQLQQSHETHGDVIMGNNDNFRTPLGVTPSAMSNLDQHAYMMLALVNGAQSAMSPPPTVTPSQVTLPSAMDMAHTNQLEQPNNSSREGVDSGLQSFAKIEFADSVFQMTTYAVIIGRDVKAIAAARESAKQEEEHRLLVEDHERRGLLPPMPRTQERTKFSKSYVSEEGGMLGPESDSEESGRPAKRRRTSTAASSQADIQEAEENMILNRQYVSHTPGAAAVDLALLRPDPYHVPIVSIHSPGPDMATKTKAISREHLKIAYNHETGVFEAITLHKNGFFHEDVHYATGKVVLKSGSRLQVKDVAFRFIINGVERGRTGAEKDKAPRKSVNRGGKEMSFDFEQAHGNGDLQETSDELSELDGDPPELSDFGDDEEGDDSRMAPEGEASSTKLEAQSQKDQSQAIAGMDMTMDLGMGELPMPQIPRKRGPGRPPKNGIMSKREQRLLKKQQQEMAKKTLPQPPPAEPPIKRKVGRPRKHPLPEGAEGQTEKRKYKPRAPKLEGAEGSDAERRAREKKEKRSRPKSPPLELKIEDYTEEQLQKPNKNYGMLIDETLSAAPDGLTLKQIYKRICERYPWFYFHTETKGWESSVRHNLIGNEAFKKDETTNLWSRVPGVELDAGKKRKATSPDRALAAQGYGPYAYAYNTGQHMAGNAQGYAHGQIPPQYQHMAQYNAQQMQSGRPPQQGFAQAGSPPQGQPLHPGAQQHAQTTGAYGQPGIQAQPQGGVAQTQGQQPQQQTQQTQQPGAYNTQFGARPPGPAQASTAIKTEDGRPAPPSAAHAQGGTQNTPVPMSNMPTPATAAGSVAPIASANPQPLPGQQQAQQQPPRPQQGAASRPPAESANQPAPRPVVDPRLLTAVVNLKNGLIENLKKTRQPKAEAIVMSALNRCIGLKDHATENEKMESICIRGIGQVISGYAKHSQSPTPGMSGSPAAEAAPPSTVFEPHVLQSLVGLKKTSATALTPRLGEARAEAVVLSAIDRALGFASASIVPVAEPSSENGEGTSAGSPKSGTPSSGGLEGRAQIEKVEGLLINAARQLIEGMNLKIVMPSAKS